MPGKLKVIVSDFHIADGQDEGFLNPWENFHHDEKFAELLRYYSTDYYEDEEVELIINGDFFDLLQVRYDGGFPEHITERIGVAKLKACLDGHPVIVDALRQFVSAPHKSITVLPGNHDFELIFPRCHQLFTDRVCGLPADDRVRFVVDRDYYEFDGVQVHHGMNFEAMNRFDWRRLFLTRGFPEPVLNLPWGSVFLLKVLNVLKERRPYVDRVHPFRLYLMGALFFDTLFAISAIWLSLRVFVADWLRRNLTHPGETSIVETLKVFFEYTAFSTFEGKVQKHFKKNPHIHTVILGHTHLPLVRRFGPHRTYVNTGTWTSLISLDIARPGLNHDLIYATVELREGEPPRTKLRSWRGYHDLWRDIHY